MSRPSTSEKLLQAASLEFQAVGYYGTDSNRIARAAGFSPQTFYRHFPDKRTIFLTVYERWSEQLLERLTALSGAADLVDAIIAHHRAWGPFRASLIALAAIDPEVQKQRRAERRRQLRLLKTRLDGSNAELLHLMWTCERIADGIALGEAKSMRVSEHALRMLVVSQVEALLP